MKRKLNMRNHVAMLIAIILVVSLVACGEEQASSTSLGSNASTQQEAVVTQPEPTTTEPTEAVTEEPAVEEPAEEVVEEPVVEEPEVINDEEIITYLNRTDDPLMVSVPQLPYDSLRWVVFNSTIDGVIKILADGDSIEILKDNIEGASGYIFFLYTPNKVADFTFGNNEKEFFLNKGPDKEINGVMYEGLYNFTEAEPEYEMYQTELVNITVTYEDGTTESLTFYMSYN